MCVCECVCACVRVCVCIQLVLHKTVGEDKVLELWHHERSQSLVHEPDSDPLTVIHYSLREV